MALVYPVRSPRTRKYDRKRRKPQAITKLKWKAPIGKSLGFPKNSSVQLRYCSAVSLSDSVGGVLDLHLFSANSIFDPDVTGIGHQPLARDQWASFYNHYKVTSSRMSIKMVNETVQGGTPVVSGCYLADDTSVPTSWTTLAEAGRGSSVVTTPANTEAHKLGTRYNSSKFFKKQGVNQSALGALLGSSPTEQAYFVLYSQAADESSGFSAMTFVVTIDYVVQFSEPKDLEQS